MALISGEGSLKPPSSVLMMLGGREPNPAAGMFRQMLDTLLGRLEAADDGTCSPVGNSWLPLEERPKNKIQYYYYTI